MLLTKMMMKAVRSTIHNVLVGILKSLTFRARLQTRSFWFGVDCVASRSFTDLHAFDVHCDASRDARTR
jgi:hypothetical protein